MLKSWRFWMFFVAPIAVIAVYAYTDPDGGRETLMRLQWLAWILVICPFVYHVRRAFTRGTRFHEAAAKAMEHPIGAGLVVLALAMLTGMLFLAFASRATAAPLPERAMVYLPVLEREISNAWPAMPRRSVLAALVEQETCPSLKSAKCWNPRAELKTSREYGFGLGQLTVAYTASGAERFNAWRDVRAQDAGLAGWSWDDRYNAELQLRALVVMDRMCFSRIRVLVDDDFNALAMCDAAYNGGYGGMLADRRLCSMRSPCNPQLWFDNVENTSAKSRQKWQGYGASAFDINRTHVRNVMLERRPKYAAWWKERASARDLPLERRA